MLCQPFIQMRWFNFRYAQVNTMRPALSKNFDDGGIGRLGFSGLPLIDGDKFIE